LVLSEREIDQLQNIVGTLEKTSYYHVTTFSDSDIQLLSKLTKYPDKYIFPAMDIIRMLVLHPDGAKHINRRNDIIKLALDLARRSDVQANQILSLRFIANALKWEYLENVILSKLDEVSMLVHILSNAIILL
jgi:phospholipase A-2-activating protein